MPTAHEYREAAAGLRRLAEFVRDCSIGFATWSLARIGAGPAVAAAGEKLRSAAALLATAGDEAGALAAMCEQRAETCDEYRRAVEHWQDLSESDRRGRPRPVPPHVWVTP